jgi:predicted translation initiation factor SUI1
MRARATDGGNLVYSTEPAPARKPPASAAKPTGDGIVRIWLEKKGRNGTPVSIIRGLPNDREALAALAGRLKRACGTGGSAKDGEIIIQGDHRERIAATLAREGLRVKLAGG